MFEPGTNQRPVFFSFRYSIFDFRFRLFLGHAPQNVPFEQALPYHIEDREVIVDVAPDPSFIAYADIQTRRLQYVRIVLGQNSESAVSAPT